MREAEPLCPENIGLNDIAGSRRGELIMYYRTNNYVIWRVKRLRLHFAVVHLLLISGYDLENGRIPSKQTY